MKFRSEKLPTEAQPVEKLYDAWQDEMNNPGGATVVLPTGWTGGIPSVEALRFQAAIEDEAEGGPRSRFSLD